MSDLLSHLPVRDTEQEFDPSQYESQSERPPRLRGGFYLVKIVAEDGDGGYMAKDDEGNEVGRVPVLFDYPRWAPNFLRLTFTAEVQGKFERDADDVKQLNLTGMGKGARLKYQQISTEPFQYGEQKGTPRMMNLIKAVGHTEPLTSDQAWADAIELALELGTEFKARIAVNCNFKTQTVRTTKDGIPIEGKFQYVKYPEKELDADGEILLYCDDGAKVVGQIDPSRPTVLARGFPEIAGYHHYDGPAEDA